MSRSAAEERSYSLSIVKRFHRVRIIYRDLFSVFSRKWVFSSDQSSVGEWITGGTIR